MWYCGVFWHLRSQTRLNREINAIVMDPFTRLRTKRQLNLPNNRVLSYDVIAVMLVFLNNETAAMLVFPTNPPGILSSIIMQIIFFYFGSFL